MIIQTKYLIGNKLNWAVAKSKKLNVTDFLGGAVWITSSESDGYLVDDYVELYDPSTNREIGAKIIEEEKISLIWTPLSGYWTAYCCVKTTNNAVEEAQNGPTVLIAGMRRYVSLMLGKEVDIPNELM